MKQTVEKQVEVNWVRIYQSLYDELEEDNYKPDRYEIFESFEVNCYHILCDYFGFPEFDENGKFNEEWFTDNDLEVACDEFENYIYNLKD